MPLLKTVPFPDRTMMMQIEFYGHGKDKNEAREDVVREIRRWLKEEEEMFPWLKEDEQ